MSEGMKKMQRSKIALFGSRGAQIREKRLVDG